jgi:hypothetical protein
MHTNSYDDFHPTGISLPNIQYISFRPYRLSHLTCSNSEFTSENIKLLEIGGTLSDGNQPTAREDHMNAKETWTYSTPHLGFNHTVPTRV